MREEIYSMKSVAPTAAAVLGIKPPSAATESPITAVVNGLSGSKNLSILAPDALGILPWKLWKKNMPFLSSLHEDKSILLKSIMPSITPVNFACMLTGAELIVHGMRTREMDFQCETLFGTIRRSGGRSAGAGLRGYSGELLLARCADLAWVTEPGSKAAVTEIIIEKYEIHKPEFLIAQYGNVDTVFHKLGPTDPGVVPMLEELDFSIKKAVTYLTAKGSSVIILADHGQHDAPEPREGENRGTHGTDSREDTLVPCTWIKAQAQHLI